MNTDFARLQMVNQQVRGWNVYAEDVLEMLKTLPRERFVPEGWEMLAFADMEIAIGHGERMMTPTIEGRLLQALSLGGEESVLEIGTGSGFMTACLASLGARVTSIDIHADFLSAAEGRLEDCGLDNVEFFSADLAVDCRDQSWAGRAYDKLLLDPPRSGAAGVLDVIGNIHPRRIVYVSCHPGSLARDAGVLVNERGYSLVSAGVMDMFPHTAHVESIALFDA